jgi:putative CocE/NonD family hydrolase
VNITVDKHVPVRMRDGVALSADIYRPVGEGRFPALVERLPYNKEISSAVNVGFDVLRASQAGYAVVVQDARGRWASEGVFNPFFDEAPDGADTIGWVAEQPWCSGEVGMVGASYHGGAQWGAASHAPPALRAIARVIGTDQYYDGFVYEGGAFQLGFNLHWILLSLGLGEVARRAGVGQASVEDVGRIIAAADGTDAHYKQLPMKGLEVLGDLAPYYDDWLDHPSYDEFWRATATRESWADVTVPSLNAGAGR